MVVKKFHLLGKDPSVSNNVHEVEIDITHDLEHAKSYVADSFSIVDPKGVGFQTSTSKALVDLDELLDAEQPIAVTIDGHAVRTPPGPKGLPIVGSHYEIYPDHLGNTRRMFQLYGPVIQQNDMGKIIYLTMDPVISTQMFQESPFWSKLIEGSHPLLSAKDNKAGLFLGDTYTDEWRISHKFLAPALAPKAVRKYTPMTQEAAEKAFKVFDQFADKNEAFDIFQYMFKLTSQAVAKLVFDIDLHHFDSPDVPLSQFISDLLEFLELVKKVAAGSLLYQHLPFGDPKKLRDMQARFQKACEDAMKKAQEKGGEDLPIATAAIDAESIADFAARAVDEDGNKLPPRMIIGALPIVVGAGFTTTAALLSWMAYAASIHPDIQDKLLQELIDHGVDENTRWNFDSTNELQYLDFFIKETQRLHNPSFQPARTALRDQIVAGGYEIPKGATMVCSLHPLHTNPEVWDDPVTFNPDRWGTEKVRKRPAGSFIPFAMGPRSCIGFNFALQETKTMFSTLLYRYKFTKFGDEAVDYDKEILVIKPQGLYIQLKRRTSWPKKTGAQA